MLRNFAYSQIENLFHPPLSYHCLTCISQLTDPPNSALPLEERMARVGKVNDSHNFITYSPSFRNKQGVSRKICINFTRTHKCSLWRGERTSRRSRRRRQTETPVGNWLRKQWATVFQRRNRCNEKGESKQNEDLFEVAQVGVVVQVSCLFVRFFQSSLLARSVVHGTLSFLLLFLSQSCRDRKLNLHFFRLFTEAPSLKWILTG